MKLQRGRGGGRQANAVTQEEILNFTDNDPIVNTNTQFVQFYSYFLR